jgi:hypothetical protein
VLVFSPLHHALSLPHDSSCRCSSSHLPRSPSGRPPFGPRPGLPTLTGLPREAHSRRRVRQGMRQTVSVEWRAVDDGRNGALNRRQGSRRGATGRAADDVHGGARGVARRVCGRRRVRRSSRRGAEGCAADDGRGGAHSVARHSKWCDATKLMARSATRQTTFGLPTTCSTKCLCGNSNGMILLSNQT